MKIKLFVIIAISIIVVLYLNNRLSRHRKTHNNNEFNIAILIPIAHSAFDEIQQGFIETLKKNITANFDVYNAQGSRTLLRGQAEKIVQSNYDLVFTLATSPSIIMKEVMNQRKRFIPLVCGAVDEPIKNGLIHSIESSGNNITTVTSQTDFKKQINCMVQLKTNIKKVLLVYNPNANLERHKKEIASLLNQKHITLTTVEVFTSNEMIQKVSGIIQGHDLVLILKDTLVVSGIEGLVALCNRFRVPLCASDLNSGDKGAAFAYGVTEYSYGTASAKQALEILKNKKSPSQVPSIFISDFKIKLNKCALHKQGVDCDEKVLNHEFIEVVSC